MPPKATISVTPSQRELIAAIFSASGKPSPAIATNPLPVSIVNEACELITHKIQSGITKGDVLLDAGLNRFARISEDSNEFGYQINFEDSAGDPLDGGGLIENDDPREIALAVFYWMD